MRVKKTKAAKLQEAVNALNKAMALEEPDIRIHLPGGLSESPETKAFFQEVKKFIKAYKEFYKLEKVEVEFTV